MTVAAAETWCNQNASCHGFTYATGAKPGQPTQVYFRDETQIFFMDSQLADLRKPVGSTQVRSGDMILCAAVQIGRRALCAGRPGD